MNLTHLVILLALALHLVQIRQIFNWWFRGSEDRFAGTDFQLRNLRSIYRLRTSRGGRERRRTGKNQDLRNYQGKNLFG